MSIRVAVILLFATGAGQAQDKPAAFSKAFITVTNKGDFELSLNFTLNVAASNDIAPFHIQKTVKPQQQITFSVPKGDYIVEAITAPQTDQETIRQLPHPSNERTNQIANNEVWTFELDKEPQESPAGDSQATGEPLTSHTWRRQIWPVRQVKEATALIENAGANLRLEPASLKEPSQQNIPAPPENLRIVPNSP